MADASPLALNAQKLAALQREHPKIDDLSIAAEFLCVLISGRLLATEKPVDDEIVSVSACIDVLSTEPSLYEELQKASTSGTVANFADSALIPALLSSSASTYLQKIRRIMQRFSAEGGFRLPYWDAKNPSHCKYDKANPLTEDTLAFLESLRLHRSLTNDILIILHRLGHFADDETLRNRVATIFTPKHKFLVNASGTGKTRLCYEGLCQNWGFYLSIGIDIGGLGSSDLDTLLEDVKGEYLGQDPASEEFQSMDKKIESLFGAVLLARLLLFVTFLETAQIDGRGFSDDDKKQWLAAQLQPDAVDVDPFEILTRRLLDNDVTYLEHNIAATLRKVRRILDKQHLFFVLDESSAAVGMFSEFLPTDSRSILQMVLGSWLHFLDDHCTIISAGIDIPKSHFLEGAGSDFEWTSETGAFDDPATQEAYVTQFLPPDFRDSDAGRFLIARIWHWLRGRHRFTASFMDLLLSEGLNHPHKCLDQYISQTIGVAPTDAISYVAAEPPSPKWMTGFHPVPSDGLTEEDKVLFLNNLLRYSATHQTPDLLGPEHIQLVYKGLAHIVDADFTEIALDEPPALLRVARKLFPHPRKAKPGEPKECPATFYKTLLRNPPQTAESLAHSLVFYLSQVLAKGKPLDAVFSFPHNPPSWAKQPAQLVRFYRSGSGGDALWTPVGANDFESFRPLATQATSIDDTLSWLEHHDGTAFCLPPSSSNADLLFALKLADEKFVWVALKALATNEPVQVAELETSFSELRRENLLGELDKPTQTRLNDALKSLPKTIPNCKLLRVVSSFPRDITETVLDASATPQMKSVAVVSLARFQSKADQIMQTEFFDAIVAGVLAGHKRKSQWEPEDDHLFTSSKRLKRRAGDSEPLASWDGPIDEDSDEEEEEEEEVAPVDKGKGKAVTTRSRSANPRPESPEETVKGKAKASSEDHVTDEAAVESSPEAGDGGRATRRRNPRRERAASGETSGPGKPSSKGKTTTAKKSKK